MRNAFIFIILSVTFFANGLYASAFTAQYIHSPQSLGSTLDTGITALGCEYWTLTQSAGNDNVSVSLGWNSQSCSVNPNDSNMRIAEFDTLTHKWEDLGGINPTGNQSAGSITSGANLTYYGAITLANSSRVVATANSYTWKGSISSNWSLDSNWTPMGVPTANDNVRIVPALNSPVINSGPVIVQNLTLVNSDSLILNAGLTVNDTLILFAGIIKTNGNPMILGASSLVPLSSNKSYIAGAVTKLGSSAFTFPVGANGDYQPISISAPTGTVGVTAQYFNSGQTFGSAADSSITMLSTCEYWTLSGNSGYVPTIGWNLSSCNVTANDSLMLIAGWNGSSWQNLGGNGFTQVGPMGTVTAHSFSGAYQAITLANKVVPCTITANAGQNVSICNGSFTTLSGSGGTSYRWAPSVSLTNDSIFNPNASPISTTTYTVTVSTSASCSSTATVTISVNPVPVVSVSGNNAVCSGSSTSLTASGALSYSWYPTKALNDSTGANVVSTPLTPITYTVSGTYANGCIGTTAVGLNVYNPPSVTISGNSNLVICAGNSSILSATGASSFLWAPSSGLSSTSGSSVTVFPPSTITYTVTGTDQYGCTNTSNTTVTVNPLPQVQVGTSATICSGSSVALSANGGNAYNWFPGAGLSSNTVANPMASPTSTTNYSVMVSNGSCSSSGSVTITVIPPPTASITVSPAYTIPSGGSPNTIYPGHGTQTLTLTGTVDANAVSYTWSPGTGLSCTNCLITQASPVASTTYTLTVTDSDGCQVAQTVTINVVNLATQCTKCQ